jgi:hypothetical protein
MGGLDRARGVWRQPATCITITGASSVVISDARSGVIATTGPGTTSVATPRRSAELPAGPAG